MNSSPEPIADLCETSLITVVVESWRFTRTVERILSKLDAGEAARYQSQLRFYVKRLNEALESANMRIVNLEGQAYDPGMAASALNIADFEPSDQLLVDQMIEPVIMGANGIRRIGTLMLKRAGT